MSVIVSDVVLPDELIKLHAEGKVVFFCGAGVSAHRGLPSFKKLVNQIECVAGLHATKETTALKRKGRYDLLLNSWETKITKQKIRDVVKEILLNNVKPCPSEKSLHRAILDLSLNSQEETIRLVTTNFDRCFESFRTSNFPKTAAYSAPFLPIPKEGSWNGVVYLHGLLEENGDECSLGNLVLTSGDFGRAYLYERWAARFVCELFRNYTVCFVGYSISDPALRYLIDAINVDLGKGAVVNPAYIFVPSSEWSAEFESLKANKAVKTITYDNKQQHRYLNETLLAWADAHKSDGTGKRKIIKEYKGWKQPLPMQEIDFVKNMFWALDDKNGVGADLFATSPKASLKWAYPLLSTKFLDGSKNIYRLKISNFGDEEPSVRDKVLWRWLCSYIDSYELIWIVCSQEGVLHPTFRAYVMDELRTFRKTKYAENSESKPLYRLWRFVLDKKVKRNEDLWRDINDPIFNTSFQGESDVDEVEWAVLKKYFSPSLKMECESSFRDDDIPHFAFNLFWDDYLIGTKLRRVCKNLLSSLRLFLLIETSLKDGFCLVQQGCPEELYSLGILIPSIQEHKQNETYSHYGFVQMVFLLRDSWQSLAKTNPEFAGEKFKEWITSKDLTFQRLALFAAQNFEVVSPKEWCAYLMSSEANLLWDMECRRELCRLLVTTANRLTGEDLNRLIDVILAGPPLKEGVTEAYQNYAVWLRLKKIAISGARLSPVVNKKIVEFETKYGFKLSKWEKEEFIKWFSTSDDEDYKESIHRIVVPTDAAGITQWLKDDIEGAATFIPSMDNWDELCQSFPENVLAGFKSAYEKHGIINKSRIESCLSIWRKKNKFNFEQDMVEFYLVNLKDEKFGDLLEVFSRWFNAVPKNMQEYENLLFTSLDRLLKFYQIYPECLSIAESHYDIIYSPIGMQVNALMRILLSMQKEIRKNGLPEQYKKFFTLLCSNTDMASVYGSAILASYINAFYSFDLDWTQKNLLPKFDMSVVKDSKESEKTAQWEKTKLLWSGVLRCSRVNMEPILDVLIEKGLFEIAEYVHESSTIEEQYVVCLIEMVFFYRYKKPSVYRKIFDTLSQSARNACLDKLSHYQDADADEITPEERWLNVSRFYKDILPRDPAKWSDEMKCYSINLLLDTGKSLEDAVRVVAPFVQGMKNEKTVHAITILSSRVKSASAVSAKGVLDFCSIAVNVNDFDSFIYKLHKDLFEILKWIAKTDESLTKKKKYIRLAEYVQKMKEKIGENETESP